LSSSLDTIEACGGGSARCMMAEVFLSKRPRTLRQKTKINFNKR
ncbi:arginine deiminase-related protein, partial [Flavobacterium sp. 3-210]